MEMTYPFTKIPGLRYLQTVARTRGWLYLASWGHRITGVLLVLYVCFHILTLSALENPALFERKMKMFAAILPVFLEWCLAVPVVYHALNGGRLILYEIFGNRKDRTVLKWVLGLSASYITLLGFFMVLGNQSVSPIFFWVYMTVISCFITYMTAIRLRGSGASLAWKLQRVSGAFLLLMIPAHMLFMHLDPALGRDAQMIISRMDNGFIKLVDFLLVCGVLYHGGYGLLGILRDYIPTRNIQLCCAAGVVVVMACFAWIGVKLVVLI
jgi:succinate dehydrogenase cytochrome b556 subunit